MKQLFTLSLLTLMSLYSLSGQDRLTSYDRGGTNMNIHLKTIDSRHYLLEAKQNDVLDVYELTSMNTKVFLHSKRIPGIRNEDSPYILGSKFSYGLKDKFYVYDFVTDSTDSLMLPSGLIYDRHYSSDSGRHLLRLKDEDENRISYVYHTAQEGFLLDDKTYLGIYEGYTLEAIREDGDYTTFVLHNYLESTTDTIAEDLEHWHRPIQVDRFFYFLDGFGQVYKFDTATRQRNELPNFYISATSAVNVYLVEEQGRLYAGHSTAKFDVYNLAAEELEASFVVPMEGTLSSFEVIDDVIIGRSYFNDHEIAIVNRISGDSRVFGSLGGTHQLLDGQYLVHLSEPSFGDPVRISLIDIQTLEHINLGKTLTRNSLHSSGIAQFGDNAVVLLNNGIYSSESLYDVDLPAKSIAINESLDPSIEGFTQFSDYFLFNEGIIIEDGALMFYRDDQLTVLQENDRHYDLTFAFNSEKIFFESNNRRQLLGFDGQEVELLIDSIANVDEMVATDQDVYYSDRWKNTLVQYNIPSGQVTVIDEDIYSPLLFVSENEFFYMNQDTLFRISTDKNIEILATEVVNNFLWSQAPPFVKMGDELLIPTLSGLKRIMEDGTSDFLVEGNIFDEYPLYLDLNKSGGHLLFGSGTTLNHYEGSDVFHIETNEDLIGGFRTVGDHYVISYFTNNESKTFFFNTNTRALQQILTETDNQSLVEYFEWLGQSRALLLTRHVNFIYDYDLIDVDEDFNQLELQATFRNRIGNSYDDVVLIDDHGLLMVGHGLFILKEDGSIQEVPEISMDGYSYDFKVADELIYFFGRDELLGRQLYVYNLELSSIDEVAETATKVSVYPNPVTGLLHTNKVGSYMNEERYEILTGTGRICGYGKNSEAIDVSYLIPGMYFLHIYTEDQRQIVKFIKE